jgi:hypothetical protein
MNRDQVRDTVNRTFYASLEESKTDLSALPPGQLQGLVRAISDSMFAVLDQLEDETPQPPKAVTTASANGDGAPAGGAATEEHVIWSGRPFLTLKVRYELTNHRLRIYRGLVGRNIEELDLVRVRDTKVKQHAGERMANIGDVTILSHDQSNPEIVLENVSDPVEVREKIRKAYLAEQERRGLRYRDMDC